MRVARLTNLDNWESIIARGSALLQRGVDFRCEPDDFRRAVRNVAKKLGCKVKITWHSREEEILDLRFERIQHIAVNESRSQFWDRILNGSRWNLIEDQDFMESRSQFRILAHKAAAKRGKVAIIEDLPNGVLIYANYR